MEKVQFKIGGMSCSFCTETIKQAVGRLDGVGGVHVSLAHEETLVEFDPEKVGPQKLKEAITDVGYTVRDPEKVRAIEEQRAELKTAQRRLLLTGTFAAAAFGLMLFMWTRMGIYAEGTFTDTNEPWLALTSLGLALLTMFWPAWYIKVKAYQSLRRGILNQHVLMEAAAFGGLIGGLLGTATLFSPIMRGLLGEDFPIVHFFAVGVFVTAYHVLSEWTSLLVRTRASESVAKLMELQPPTARVVRDGKELELSIDQVRSGDLVRVRPGESIPIDGVVEEGISGVDQSLVTGESMPVEKGKGDEVIGGSLNQTGSLLVRVTRVGAESFLQKVAQHIQEARALKPGILLLVDTVLKYFVPAVFIAAILAFLIWTVGALLITGEPNFGRALFAALAALVMGYPCALGMATPLAMIRGGGEAARKGILMRSGEAFQVFKDVRKVVLDKTGTITMGKPAVSAVISLRPEDEAEMVRLAASVEAASEHPLGRAIVEYASERRVDTDGAQKFRAHTGKGVEATVGGHRVLVGTARFLQEQEVDTSGLEEKQADLEEQGQTVVAVATDRKIMGLLAIGDTLKEDAREAVTRMKAEGLEPVMITGDNKRTAKSVAAQVGIEQVLAQVLPQDKAHEVRKLQEQGYRVAMVGDGINDAPALMQADVGIAIGAGTDIAIESADVILVGDRLGGVVDAYRIGKSSYAKTVQNVSLAFTFNGIGVPTAMTGFVHPIWAMIAMVGSVSAVLLNSFAGRLLPKVTAKRPREEVEEAEKETEVFGFKVPTIHCEGCVGTIRDALSHLPEVAKVEGNPKEKKLKLAVRRGTSRDRIAYEISKLGHSVG